MIVVVLVLALLAVLLAWPAPAALARARWPRRDPVVALFCWQAVGLAGGLALIGAPLVLGLSPWGSTLPTAAWGLVTGAPAPSQQWWHVAALVVAAVIASRLLWVLGRSALRVGRVRRHHRALLAVVVRPGTDPRTHLVDVGDLVAFCIPGGRVPGGPPMIVLSAGMVAELDDAQIAAVVAHEQAHLRERHHLFLLPFVAWHEALPWVPATARAEDAVHALVEMRADDVASRSSGRIVLAGAIARTGSAPAPAGSLAVHAGVTTERVERLLGPPAPLPVAARAGWLSGAALLLVAPTVLLVLAELS